MKWANGGYTVIEVLIVLAITTAIFLSAATIFRGKQAETQFNQAMYDLESKINLVVGDVGRSVYPGESYTCDTSGDNRPYLTFGSTGPIGGSQNCIFLGKAIEAKENAEQIRVYTVLGNRTYLVGGTRAPVTSFDQAQATIAANNADPPVPIEELIENHSITSGDAKIIWACADSTGGCAVGQRRELAGFYNSLQNASAPAESYGSQSLITKSYRMNPAASAQDCVTNSASCPPPMMADFTSWTLCLASNNGKNAAILTVNSSPAGISTQLQFKPDPAVCPGP